MVVIATYVSFCLLYGVYLKVHIGGRPRKADGKISANTFQMYLEMRHGFYIFGGASHSVALETVLLDTDGN